MKKLFTYLLISSMVVLSSCTNYDDQFDDLNSQLSTLKSQIEGFSALSSGITALQGTVSSLQSAVAALPKTATPATDISGLATAVNVTALQTSLTALAAEVTALQASLATAATSADVSALAASLVEAQSDLAKLLAMNNVYSSELIINSPATLAFATSLGDRVAIVNEDVTVTQTATMDKTELAAVLAKMKSVTGDVIYNATGTSVTPTAGFTSLTSVRDLTVNADGDISFPVLATAAVVGVTENSKTTSFAAPKLTSVTSFLGKAIALSKATSIDLASLIRYDDALSITIKSGELDLSALTNTQVGITTLSAHKLTIVGAETLVAPLRVKGEIDANDLTAVDLPLWEWKDGSSFTSAKTITLPSVTGAASIAIQSVAPKATSVSITAAKKAVSTTQTDYATVTAVANTNLESLTLSGDFQTVQIDDASSLISLSLSGAAHTLHVIETDIVDLVLANTTTLADNDYSGVLIIKDNDSMESIVADSIDDVRAFTLQGNPQLSSISFAALNSVGTTAAAAPSTVLIGGVTADLENDLDIENIQLPSEEGDLPVITKKVSSADMAGLAAFLTAAKAKVYTTGKAIALADDVLAVTSAAGVKDESPTVSTAYRTVINWNPSVTSNATGGVAAAQEFQIPATSAGDWTFTVGPSGSAYTSIIDDGASALAFDLAAWADDSTNKTNFAAIGVEVTTGSPYKGKIEVTGVPTSAAVYAVTVEGETFTASLAANSSDDEIVEALRAKIASGSGVLTSATYSVTTSTVGPKLLFTTGARGSASGASDLDLSVVTGYLNVTLATNSGTLGSSTSVSSTKLVEKDLASGWIRVKSLTAGLDAATATVASITGGTVASATSLLSTGLQTATKTTGDDENVVYAKEGVGTTVSAATVALSRIDNTTFLSAS